MNSDHGTNQGKIRNPLSFEILLAVAFQENRVIRFVFDIPRSTFESSEVAVEHG